LKADLLQTEDDRKVAVEERHHLWDIDKSFAIIDPAARKALELADGTEQYLDSFRKFVEEKKNQGLIVGPLANYTVGQIWKFMKPDERVAFESRLTHEVPRMLQLLSSGQPGGFSVLRFKGSQELLQKMGFTSDMKVSQMEQVFSVVDESNRQNRRAKMDAFPLARFDLIPSLLGRDADYRPKGWNPYGGTKTAKTGETVKVTDDDLKSLGFK